MLKDYTEGRLSFLSRHPPGLPLVSQSIFCYGDLACNGQAIEAISSSV